MKFRILFGAATMVAIGLVGATSIASAHPSGTRPMAYTCAGGDKGSGSPDPSTWNYVIIPSGTYSSLTVTGVCYVAPGTVINVVGNVNVAAGAVLDAQTFSSTITVGHNVTAVSGSLLGLGCLPNPPKHTTGHPCADDPASSSITVNGNVTAANADTVLLNGITVKGNVTLAGGGENFLVWPIKMNMIGGNLIISGVTPNWLGVIRNKIGGNAILTNITITDPGDPGIPTIFVASNTVGQNLICTGLVPSVAGGFNGEVNVVGGKAIGQCANLPTILFP